MRRLLTVFILVLSMAAGASAQIAIDDFQAGEYGLGREGITPPCITSATLLDPTGLHIIGGQRDVSLEKFTGSTTQPYANCMPTVEFEGVLGVSTYNSAFGCNGEWIMVYGMGGPLHADLTSTGAMAIEVDLISGDMYSGPRPVPLTITLESDAGTASVTRDLILLGVYEYPFTEFVGVNLTDVNLITVTVVQDSNINDAVDFALGSIMVPCYGSSAVDATTWSRLKTLYR